MKKFDFRLERVRQWREKQISIEEARLERLFAESAAIHSRIAELEREQQRNEASVTRATGVEAVELEAIDAFRRHAKIQRRLLAEQQAGCARRIETQRAALMEARRKFELLNQLKQRKLHLWTAEFDRDLEAQAAESYLARWNAAMKRS
jgi:flagellar export protein FliJ